MLLELYVFFKMPGHIADVNKGLIHCNKIKWIHIAKSL